MMIKVSVNALTRLGNCKVVSDGTNISHDRILSPKDLTFLRELSVVINGQAKPCMCHVFLSNRRGTLKAIKAVALRHKRNVKMFLSNYRYDYFEFALNPLAEPTPVVPLGLKVNEDLYPCYHFGKLDNFYALCDDDLREFREDCKILLSQGRWLVWWMQYPWEECVEFCLTPSDVMNWAIKLLVFAFLFVFATCVCYVWTSIFPFNKMERRDNNEFTMRAGMIIKYKFIPSKNHFYVLPVEGTMEMNVMHEVAVAVAV